MGLRGIFGLLLRVVGVVVLVMLVETPVFAQSVNTIVVFTARSTSFVHFSSFRTPQAAIQCFSEIVRLSGY